MLLGALLGLWMVAAPARADDVTVAVARLPLPAGKKLDWDDLSTIKLPEELVPPTAVVLGADLVGKTLSMPVAVQSPIVRQRLVGMEVAPAPVAEGPAEQEVARELGVVAAIVQAGDKVGFVQVDASPACVIAWGEVVRRGSPATVRVPAYVVPELTLADDAAVLVPGPGARPPALPLCKVPPPADGVVPGEDGVPAEGEVLLEGDVPVDAEVVR